MVVDSFLWRNRNKMSPMKGCIFQTRPFQQKYPRAQSYMTITGVKGIGSSSETCPKHVKYIYAWYLSLYSRHVYYMADTMLLYTSYMYRPMAINETIDMPNTTRFLTPLLLCCTATRRPASMTCVVLSLSSLETVFGTTSKPLDHDKRLFSIPMPRTSTKKNYVKNPSSAKRQSLRMTRRSDSWYGHHMLIYVTPTPRGNGRTLEATIQPLVPYRLASGCYTSAPR